MEINDSKLLRELRHKTEKTDTEILLLNMNHIIVHISEILVSESKWHMTSEQALEEIRKALRNY